MAKDEYKDKNKFYLEIDGEPVKVGKNGKFEFEGFVIDPEEGEVIKIIATDKRKNRSEKIVKINVDLKATTVAKTYEKLKPNSIRVKTDKNKIAIIIGAENYKNMTKCNYCNRDAKAFRAYATQALGVHASNIITLIDEDATRGQILKTFKIQLRKIAADGGKDIHVFFAGHGLASENGDDIYLIPQDGDQSLLEDTAVSRVNLIKLIKKVNPKSVTMFIDSCYSGQTRSEKMLVATIIALKKIQEREIPHNFKIFTASSTKQGNSHI
ncbi:MAG: caspase family protein [SAR202 cluster bacterium]|nr:caspase family protein [SAR202 cluster bacterium]